MTASKFSIRNLERLSAAAPVAEKIHLGAFSSYLKPRDRDWYKGRSGHVLIVGGALGFAGAPRMAGMAALRVGAGLVSIATDPQHAAMMNMTFPEIMCHGVKDENDLNRLIEKVSVIVVGPGLQLSTWSKMLWQAVCQHPHPLLLDADALNILATTNRTNDHWILTPHPGEAARLLQSTPAEIQKDRLQAASAIQRRYGGICVLKGAGTLITAHDKPPALCDKGNPGMATAGTGDILSGVIGGLMAQGVPSWEAAKLGVYLHAAAGDLAAKEGERGMIATDLIPYLRILVNDNQHDR